MYSALVCRMFDTVVEICRYSVSTIFQIQALVPLGVLALLALLKRST